MRDKAFRFVPKCLRCGRAKNQHRAGTLECPKGRRTPRGYLEFATERFVGGSGQPTADAEAPPPEPEPEPEPE